jgi:hypothetical protein
MVSFSRACQSNPLNHGWFLAAPGLSWPNLRFCFLNSKEFIKSTAESDHSGRFS